MMLPDRMVGFSPPRLKMQRRAKAHPTFMQTPSIDCML